MPGPQGTPARTSCLVTREKLGRPMTMAHSCLSPMSCRSLHSFRPVSGPEGDEVVGEGRPLQCPLWAIPGTAALRRAVLFFQSPGCRPSWELFGFNYSSQARERIIVLAISKTKALLSCNPQTQPSCFWKLLRLLSQPPPPQQPDYLNLVSTPCRQELRCAGKGGVAHKGRHFQEVAARRR